jgi:hypothetical protein
MGGLDLSKVERMETELNVTHVANDDQVATALYELARRGRTPLNPVVSRANRVRDILSELPDPARRLNGVTLIRRAK